MSSLFESDPKVVNTTTTTSSPLDPYIKQILNKPKYTGQTVAPFSSQTNEALSLQASRARNGSPLISQANQLSGDILSGQYLNSNPYLDATFEKASRAVTPQINSTFSASGRTGSNAHAASLGTALADLGTGIYGGNYAQERQNQMTALQGAPALAAQDYTDISQLGQVGALREAKTQQMLDDAYRRYYSPLDIISGLSGKTGQTTTSGQPYYQPSTFSQLLGAATGIGGLASLFL